LNPTAKRIRCSMVTIHRLKDGRLMLLVAALGLGLLFVGVPVAFALGLAGIFGVWLADIPQSVVATRLFTGVDSFVFLAVPFYILAAEIMSQGGITTRLIAIGSALTSWLRGGTALRQHRHVGPVRRHLGFGGGRCGCAGARLHQRDAEGRVHPRIRIGSHRQFVDRGSDHSALGACHHHGCRLGVVGDRPVPCGDPARAAAGRSLRRVVAIDALRGRVPKPRRSTLHSEGLGRMLIETVAVLTLPVIIIGGMLAGIYTATEGGGIAVAYAVFLSVVVFRAMTLKGLWLAFLRAARDIASIYLLVAAATILSYALNILGISAWVSTAAGHFQDSPVLFLFAVAGLMLVLGTFLDIGAAILIFTPLIMPVVYTLGIDPMQASMVIMLTLAMGLLTPPVGVVLFVVMRVGDVRMLPLIRALAPFLLAQLAAIALICLIPGISNTLPNLLN
jgi:TRAP-type transport system large permease protein